MKSLFFTSAAALLLAGAANAAEIKVVERPGSNVQVVFTDNVIAPTAPLTGSFDTDVQGMMSADVVQVGELPPGFEADALIYIWQDENGAMRVGSPMPVN